MDKKLFSGSGGSGDAPTDTPDSLFSEDTIEFALVVSEGPIRGLTQGAKSFYVGDTALVSSSGARNFDKFAIGVHPGYPSGSALPIKYVLGGTTSSYQIGVALQQYTSVTRQTDAILRGTIDEIEVRLNIQRAVYADDSGTYETDVIFDLEYKKSADLNWVPFYGTTTVTLHGKTTGGVVKEFKVSVPRITDDDWQIRVTKRSPDNDTHTIVSLSWDSFQCTTKENPTYPDTAVIHAVGVANGQFSSIPDFSGIYDGMLMLVPTNYNPDTRTYDETTPWNGSFKLAWTNNNAWILYNFIVNPRWGMAKYRRYIDANRFTFYEAAKWCDEAVLVNGGPETRPRYTFNMWLTDPRPGMEMLNYIAGSFNALVYDDLHGQIHLKVDKDDPAVQLYTPENVTEEGFRYTFTDATARANDITVHFINPDLDWQEDVRRIPNVTTSETAIAKFGSIPLSFIAVGCTNVHEAVTKAQVRLISAQTETKMVTFTATKQAVMLELYEVFLIADPLMGWSEPRRLTSFDDQYMYFRDPLYIETLTNYTVKFQTVEGIVEVTAAPEATGNVYQLRLITALPANIPRYCVFTVEDTTNYGLAKPFRVMSIEDSDDGYTYKITGIEINRYKYSQAENVTNLSTVPYSYKSPGVPGAISNLRLESGDDQLMVLADGTVFPRIYVSFTKPFAQVVDHYVVQWRETGTGDWTTETTKTLNYYLSPVIAGKGYDVRVAAVVVGGEISEWVEQDNYIVVGKSKIPQGPVTFAVTGDLYQNKLSWSFGTASDIKKIVIYASQTNDLQTATIVAEISYPTTAWVHTGLSVDDRWYYWNRLQDTSGNYSDYAGPIVGTTVSDPGKILSILHGSLTESELYTTLNDRINLVDGPSTLANSVSARIQSSQDTLNAIINTEKDNRIADVNLVRNDVTTLQGQVNDPTTGLAAAVAAINEINNVTIGSTSASASQLATLITTVNDPSTGLAAAVASINEINNVITTSTSANASALATLKAQVNDASTGLPAAIASINEINNVSATSTSASAQYLYSLNSTVSNHSTTIQTLSQTTDGLSAQYTVKINNNGWVAGYGLASQAVDGAVVSSFIVMADKFAVVTPTALSTDTPVTPFVVGTVNGQTTVGINGAVVVDGSIVARHLGVTSLSSISADIGTVTAGRMQSNDGLFVIDLNAKTISITV